MLGCLCSLGIVGIMVCLGLGGVGFWYVFVD